MQAGADSHAALNRDFDLGFIMSFKYTSNPFTETALGMRAQARIRVVEAGSFRSVSPRIGAASAHDNGRGDQLKVWGPTVYVCIIQTWKRAVMLICLVGCGVVYWARVAVAGGCPNLTAVKVEGRAHEANPQHEERRDSSHSWPPCLLSR